MKNLSQTNKILIGLGILVIGYYGYKMWKTHETEEANKKIVNTALGNPPAATTTTPPIE